MTNSDNNKRIAKNTILLYFRMFLTMGVLLYTSRVVLNTLGVVDFGIYNVVGGVVMMLSFLSSAMSTATQRFLSFEIGKKDFTQLNRVFSASVNIHVVIAVAIFILAETLGLWFLNTKLNIPAERMNAANWVYQFSILSFMVSVICVPYTAMIVAQERMNIYAYLSILEVLLKLFILYVLVQIGFDKLKLYAILVFCVTVIIQVLYKIYCTTNFTESRYILFWDKALHRTLMGFAGWNLFGNMASVTFNQGINILLNIFFGPVINAARGIAYQVNSAVNGFVTNFQMAMNPQIIKSYAVNEKIYMHQLIFQGSKYSFFLLFFLCLPILLETEIILSWWLMNVPEYTVLFCRLILINTLIDCISGPLMTAAQASGRIKKYQLVVGGLLLLILPLSYMFLKMGYPPQTTIYVSILISIIALYARLIIISPLVDLSILKFTQQVIVRVLIVVLASFILPLIFKYSINHELIQFFTVVLVSFISVGCSIYFLGMKKEEKLYIRDKVSKYVLRITRT